MNVSNQKVQNKKEMSMKTCSKFKETILNDNFASLPIDIMFKILGYLDVFSLYKVRFLNKRFFGLVNSHITWTPIIHEYFGLDTKTIKKIGNPFNWFLHQVCINSHLSRLEKMPDNAKLEFQFELSVLNHRIPYNTCVLPLRILHGPLQNNISIFLLILQTILIYMKLDEIIDYSWFILLSPVWLFNILLLLCSLVWFYFQSKGIITEVFADQCLYGWIKNILNVLQMGCKWINYASYFIICVLCLCIFPILFVIKMDSLLFENNSNPATDLPWICILSPIIIGLTGTIAIVHRRIYTSHKENKYHWLGILKFIMIELYLSVTFLITVGLHLDGYMPSFWNFKYSFTPLFVICLVALLLIANAFNHDNNGRWNWVIRRMAGSFMTTVPIILLITVFLTFLVLRIESINEEDNMKGNYLFSFCYLFAVESLVVLYWLQDIIDFGGYKQYDARKKFEFSLKEAMNNKEKKRSDNIFN